MSIADAFAGIGQNPAFGAAAAAQQPQYDSNGYITNSVQGPDMSAPNPWSAMAQESNRRLGDASNMAANIPQYQQNLANKSESMNSYGASTATPQINYPALPNDYGLGKDSSAQAAQQTNHGFNPWSLQGEALSR